MNKRRNLSEQKTSPSIKITSPALKGRTVTMRSNTSKEKFQRDFYPLLQIT